MQFVFSVALFPFEDMGQKLSSVVTTNTGCDGGPQLVKVLTFFYPWH